MKQTFWILVGESRAPPLPQLEVEYKKIGVIGVVAIGVAAPRRSTLLAVDRLMRVELEASSPPVQFSNELKKKTWISCVF